MNQKQIGLFLKELRKEKHLTQEQVAEQFGVSNRSVSRWENGVNLPDFDLVIEISNFFDISVDEFLDGERKVDMISEKEQQTIIKIADYDNIEKVRFSKRLCGIFICAIAAFIVYAVIEMKGLASTGVYEDIASFALGFVFGTLLLGVLFTSRYMSKIQTMKKRLLAKLKATPHD